MSNGDLIVSVEQGELRGTTGKDYYGATIYKFLGVPYAKAPVGDLRFKAPQPPEPWKGVRDATKEGPECPSTDMYFTYFIGNEDNCLNLNIYTKEICHKIQIFTEIPKDTLPVQYSTTKKPVMVWIHGGGFTFGSNKSHSFGPDYLMTQDIVMVAINYRLGIFGFASFEDESLNIPGNAGLKDMRQALKWIQKNIHQFGGDPNNVTIFGESAGSSACHYLTLSSSTKGLFHKAIMQSGSALSNWAWGKHNAAEIAKCLGYKETDEKSILQKLRQETGKSIVKGQKKLLENFLPSMIRPFGPVVEKQSNDAFLTENPYKIISEGRSHHIPMIIGYNSREGIFFELVRRTVPGITLPKNLEDEIPYELGLDAGSEKSTEVADSIKNFYYGNEKACEKNIEKTYMMKGDSNFIYGIQKNIHLQSKHSTQPVYAYTMTLDGPFNYFKHFCLVNYFKTIIICNFLAKISPECIPSINNALKRYIQRFSKRTVHGVAHADDLFYIFPTFFTPPVTKDSKEDKYIQRFVQLWANFATTGNPTSQTNETLCNITWKPFKSGEEILDIGHELKMVSNTDWERLQFWDKLYETYYKK